MPMGVLEGGLSIRFVALQMGCAPATIINLRRFHKETDSANDRACPGRKTVTPAYFDGHIVLRHFRYEFCMAAQALAETPGSQRKCISSIAVHQRLHAADLQAQIPFFLECFETYLSPN